MRPTAPASSISARRSPSCVAALRFRVFAGPIRLNRLRRHHDADPVRPHRGPNLLDLREGRAGRGAGERQQPHVFVRLGPSQVPSSVSPICASSSRICFTWPAVPRTNRLRVVMSASTRGADGSGFSRSRPPKSLVIESTATCGSTVESGITATWRASRCICSIVARIVACWAGRAKATRWPVTGSTASRIDCVAFEQRLQDLQHRLRIGRGDRIDFELRCSGNAAGRVGDVDQPQHFLDAGDAFGRAVDQQLPAGDVFADIAAGRRAC